MACGPGAGLTALKDKAAGLKNSLKGLTSGASGLFDNIDSLGGTLDSKLSDLGGSLKEMLPKIELPELPELPDLKLPKLKLPELSLQGEIKSVLNKLKSNNPLDKAAALKNLESLKDKFPDVNLDALKSDILNGKIDLDNLCKLVPNIEKVDGKLIEKGIPATAPEIDALKLPDPATLISASAVQETAAKLQASINQQKSFEQLKNIQIDVGGLKDDIDKITSKLDFPITF